MWMPGQWCLAALLQPDSNEMNISVSLSITCFYVCVCVFVHASSNLLVIYKEISEILEYSREENNLLFQLTPHWVLFKVVYAPPEGKLPNISVMQFILVAE